MHPTRKRPGVSVGEGLAPPADAAINSDHGYNRIRGRLVAAPTFNA